MTFPVTNDTTIRVPLGHTAENALWWRGTFYDFAGNRRDCDHRHSTYAEAQACAESSLAAFTRKNRSWRKRARTGASQ